MEKFSGENLGKLGSDIKVPVELNGPVRQEYESMSSIADALQKACDEFRNRICMGFPVEHEVGVPESDINFQVKGKVYNDPDWK